MPRRPKVDPESALMNGIAAVPDILPADFLRTVAKETQWSERIRKIDPALFFWNLILGFGPSMERTLAALRKRLCTISAEDLSPSSFFDRFNKRLVVFLEQVLQYLLASTVRSTIPRKVLTVFRDVLVIDSTIVRLLDSLAKVFPGAGMPAAVKISAVLSVATDNLHRMGIYAGTKAEIKTLKLGTWVKDCLLLFDLGFFKYAEFDRIINLGGHFISRLHGNADPEIVADNRKCRGRAIDLVGKKIRSCLAFLKREILDVRVKVEIPRRERGTKGAKSVIMRLVGILNEETGDYHLYLTDLAPEVFDAAQIADLYRGRWCVELLFKELKSRYALDVIHTGKPEIVRALIYTALITLVISRRIFVAYRDAMARGGQVVTPEKWARFFVEHAGYLLRQILRLSKIEFTEELLLRMALRETVSTEPLRERLEDVWNG